jgi:hypothetical protein
MNMDDNAPIIDAEFVDDESVFTNRGIKSNEKRIDERGSKMKALLSMILTVALLMGIGYLGIKILDNSSPIDPSLVDSNKQALANQVSALNEKVKDKINQIKNLGASSKPTGDTKVGLGKDEGRLRVPKGYGPIDEEDKQLTEEILREQSSPKTDEKKANDMINHVQKKFTETDDYQYRPEDLKRINAIRELYVKASEILD